MQLFAIIKDAFRDVIDRKIFWVMLIITFVIAAVMFCISFNDNGIDILFGAWTVDSGQYAIDSEDFHSAVGALVVAGIADNYLGWIGIIVALVATASNFPALLESGNIDIVASKPLKRSQIFLGRYLGAMVFIFMHTSIFVLITFLVMGVRWSYWSWGYFWLIPLVVLMFSYVYAFCALFGVITQKSLTALMLTLVVWVFFFIIQTAYTVLITNPDFDKTGKWTQTLAGIHWVVPKTQDIPIIAGRLMGADDPTAAVPIDSEHIENEDERRQFEQSMDATRELAASISPWASIGSSLAVEAVVIFVALWRFNRRDL